MRNTSPVLMAAALAALACEGRAQTTPSAPGAGDARASFARSVTLYADGNYEAALVELQRAHSLSHNPNLYFNLGAVYESLGRFVEARDALEAYRMGAAAANVAQRSAELDARLARLRERIGTLRVTVPTQGLRVTVDGQEVSPERARGGIAVSAGRRRVRLEAQGHVTRDLEVDIAGGGEHAVTAGLDVRTAPLTLRVDTDFASVQIGGREVARTPLEGPVMLPEGAHQLEVARAGYLSVRREVALGVAGAVVDVSLAWDPAMPPSVAARLRVESNVAFPTVNLDGRGVVADGSVPVPPGRHQVRVSHAGYVPTLRSVDLTAGENTAMVWLDATPTLRAEYADRVRRQRTVAYVVGALGIGLMAGGAVLLVTGLASRDAANAESERIAALQSTCRTGSSPECLPTAVLEAMFQNSNDAFTAATWQSIAGGATLGVGLAAAVTGVVLRLRADPSNRYDRPARWAVTAGFGDVSLRGTF